MNRLNIGVQSFDDGILAFLGRRHDREQAVAAVTAARIAGIENIGIDLIYGVPGQGMDAWLATLREAVALNPDHLSCYQLTLEEGTPLAERCRRGEVVLPDESLQADFFCNTAEFLEENGYIHYEVSNFARPGRESRHNRKYWNHAPYLGLGPAAHSFSGRERRWNRRSVNAYIDDLASGTNARRIQGNPERRTAPPGGPLPRFPDAPGNLPGDVQESVTARTFSRKNGI